MVPRFILTGLIRLSASVRQTADAGDAGTPTPAGQDVRERANRLEDAASRILSRREGHPAPDPLGDEADARGIHTELVSLNAALTSAMGAWRATHQDAGPMAARVALTQQMVDGALGMASALMQGRDVEMPRVTASRTAPAPVDSAAPIPAMSRG